MIMSLTQAVFDNAPDWAKSAAVDSDGEAYFYSVSKSDLEMSESWYAYLHNDDVSVDFIGEYDATDWQNSAIDRVSYENKD